MAHALAMRDHAVLIIGRQEEALIDAASFSALISYLCADVSTDEGRALILERLRNLSTISGFIHNAGIIEPILPITAIDEISWRQVIATNLDAPLFLSQLLQDKLMGAVCYILILDRLR